MDLLADLNPQQVEAVTHVEGPLLVLAGAGSGKTRVITRRVAHLIEKGVSPGEILAITFTNKAAGEMQERVAQLVPGGRVWISTFHKFCARVLRIHGQLVGLHSGYVIYDTTDRLKVIRDCIARLSLDRSRWPAEQVEHAISRAKNDLLDPVAYSEKASDYFKVTVSTIYRAYQEQLLQSNAVDFDDLLLHVATLLRDHADLRAELDSRYRFILVDEYQDTNLAQYAILRSLSIDHPNLCATGDPDQSIYGWRGANIKNILRFETDYPGTRVVRLEMNYRSTKKILAAASQLIRFNTRRKPKELITENADGLPVRAIQHENERDEADAIALSIREAVESGGRQYGDFAVFCRVAALTRNLEMAFSAIQVPYQVLSGVAFYERAEVKDLLAYLKLLVNPRDDVAFARIINVPARGIGKSTLDRLEAEAARTGRTLLETARAVVLAATGDAAHTSDLPVSPSKARPIQALQRFVELIDQLTAMKDHCVAEVMRQVMERIDYFGERSDRAKSTRRKTSRLESLESSELRDEKTDERRANVEELISAAHQFDVANPGSGVEHFLAESVLATDLDAWDPEHQAVSLMTLHAAKGLEFPVVFIVAVEHGLLPHQRSTDSEESIEEERRLLFVGITRAREELCLSHVVNREFRGLTVRAIPSRFLVELSDRTLLEPARPAKRPARMPSGVIRTAAELAGQVEAKNSKAAALREGMLVNHEMYGLGRITSLSGSGRQLKATVKFATAGTRTFVVDKAHLQPVKTNS